MTPRRPIFAILLLAAAAACYALAGDRAPALLGESAAVVLGSAAIAAPWGVAIALLLVKTPAPGGRAAVALLVALLLTPLYLHAAAWMAAFGLSGWWTLTADAAGPIDPLLDGRAGVAWIHGVAATPWIALITAAGLRSVDRRQEEAALLDAAPLTVLGRITLRHTAPAIIAAVVWASAMIASEMTVTDLLRVRTFAEEIYTQIQLGLFQPGADAAGATFDARGLWLGTAMLVLLGAGGMALAMRYATRAIGGEPWRIAAQRWWLGVVLWGLLTPMVAAPVVNLAYQASVTAQRVDPSEEGANSAGWRRDWSAGKLIERIAVAPWRHRGELGQSLLLGMLVAVGATSLGAVVAWRMAHGGVVAGLLLIVLATCLFLPGPLIGAGVIRLLNQPPDSPLAWLAPAYDSLFAPWLAQMVRATPVATLVLWPAMASVPRTVIDAARLDGAGYWAVLVRIVLASRKRAVAAAALVAFAISFGELPATLLVMPPGTPTVTIRIFGMLHSGADAEMAALSLVLFAMFAAIGFAVVRLARK